MEEILADSTDQQILPLDKWKVCQSQQLKVEFKTEH